MSIKMNSTVHFDVATHSPVASGFVVNADQLPRFWVFENENDTPIIAYSGMALRSGFTGLYKGQFHVSDFWGFEPNKFYNVMVSGRVDQITSWYPRLTFWVENTGFDDLAPATGVVYNLASTSGILRQNLDKTGYILDPSQSGQFIYYADIHFIKDTTNTRDEYTVTFYRNDYLLPSGAISTPQIQVINRSNGTDLIATANMDFISINTGTVKYNEATNRTTAGESYLAKVNATIDGVARTWQKLVGRDA